MSKIKIFDKFTNLYPLNKTLQFELEPLSKIEFINKIAQEDIKIQTEIIPLFKEKFNQWFEKIVDSVLSKLENSFFINENIIKNLKEKLLSTNEKKSYYEELEKIKNDLETNFKIKLAEIIFPNNNYNEELIEFEKEKILTEYFKKTNDEELLNQIKSFSKKFGLIKDFILTKKKFII